MGIAGWVGLRLGGVSEAFYSLNGFIILCLEEMLLL